MRLQGEMISIKKPRTNMHLNISNREWLAVLNPASQFATSPTEVELKDDDVMRKPQGSIRQLDCCPDSEIGVRDVEHVSCRS